MGGGKTYIAIAVAIIFKLPVFVVCPKSAREEWERLCALYGVAVVDLLETGGVITYDTFRSRKGYQPRHGLLTRDDVNSRFAATPELEALFKNGVLVVFDEFQKLKNSSTDQYRAAQALIKTLYKVGGRSRIAFLSGSAIDKPEQAINFLRLVGFITQPKLYTKVNGRTKKEGIQDLCAWARHVNKEAFERFDQRNICPTTQTGAAQYVFNLFIAVIKPSLMSIMPSLKLDIEIKNGYYILDPEDDHEYIQAIDNLERITKYNPSTRDVVRSKDNLGAITSAQIRLQKAKMKAMARRCRERLTNNPNLKRILYANYYEVIDYLLKELKDFNPLELTGRVSEDVRNDNIRRFQEPNCNYRLIIANPVVGGLCINLHDTNGLFPREADIMPGFDINVLHQAAYRIARYGMVGTARVRFFYGLSGSKENKIQQALDRKGGILQQVHLEQDTIFPNNYQEEYEVV